MYGGRFSVEKFKKYKIYPTTYSVQNFLIRNISDKKLEVIVSVAIDTRGFEPVTFSFLCRHLSAVTWNAVHFETNGQSEIGHPAKVRFRLISFHVFLESI